MSSPDTMSQIDEALHAIRARIRTLEGRRDILGRPEISGEDKTYRHVQIVAIDTWVINHNLGKYPTVAVVDTSGAVMIGELHYTTLSKVTITFSAAVSGEAYCN